VKGGAKYAKICKSERIDGKVKTTQVSLGRVIDEKAGIYKSRDLYRDRLAQKGTDALRERLAGVAAVTQEALDTIQARPDQRAARCWILRAVSSIEAKPLSSRAGGSGRDVWLELEGGYIQPQTRATTLLAKSPRSIKTPAKTEKTINSTITPKAWKANPEIASIMATASSLAQRLEARFRQASTKPKV
jgi:hypothetical protein